MEYLHGHSIEQAHHVHTEEHTHVHDCTETANGHFCTEVTAREKGHAHTEGPGHEEEPFYTEVSDRGKEDLHTEKPAHGHRGFHTGESGHDHAHIHEHRGMKEIRQILLNSEMTDRAKETALHIFQILAKAEAKAHGVSEEQVHFHEVGAVDSIVDIAAAAVCLDDLDITEVIVPKLCEGTGFVRCQHGTLPVPVPAVVNIVQQNRLTLKITDIEGELVTPTGAAIVAAIKTSDCLPENSQWIKPESGQANGNMHVREF